MEASRTLQIKRNATKRSHRTHTTRSKEQKFFESTPTRRKERRKHTFPNPTNILNPALDGKAKGTSPTQEMKGFCVCVSVEKKASTNRNDILATGIMLYDLFY